MKKLFIIALCALALSACNQGGKNQQESQEEPQYEELNQLAFATLSVINMREDPDYAAELGTQALMGTPLKLHYAPEDDYWVNVETPDGYKAWVNDAAVRVINQTEYESWKASRRVIVTNFYTFFLEEPKEDAQHICDGVWGCIAQYSGEVGKYTEVILPTLKKAYVPTADVQDFDEWANSRKAVVAADADEAALQSAREEIIATAKQFLGIPYLWAGTSIKGVDCSGFSKSVYYLNGYLLLRNASQQYKTGDPVDISEGYDNLAMGDLIFFGREATEEKPEKITHVGIYIGDGEFIHSSGVVRINSLKEGAENHYYRSPIRAARIIGTQESGKDVYSIAKSEYYFD